MAASHQQNTTLLLRRRSWQEVENEYRKTRFGKTFRMSKFGRETIQDILDAASDSESGSESE